MRLWPRPSLARRVVLALLTAFLLVWLVLVAREFMLYKDETRRSEDAARIARIFGTALDSGDAARARIVIETSEVLIRQARKAGAFPKAGDVLLLLERRDGTPVYASAPVAGSRIPASGPAVRKVALNGQVYWTAVHTTEHWRLQLMDPLLSDMEVLRCLGRDLVPSLLIAFPIVLLPVWLAVRRGLAPLRAFVARVEARAPDDASPLDVRLKHAELIPLGTAINALLARVRHSIAAERAFVQDAAHELRTPLAALSAQAHVLANADDGAQREEARGALELVVARTSHVVQQLHVLAALEGGAGRAPQEVDLVGLARDILVLHSPAAAAKSIDIGLDSPDRLVSRLDPAIFHSILENLLANAVAYCPNGARVAVVLEEQGGECRLSVADDGNGIAPADRERVFERFFRGRDVNVRGSGLGLAIVRQAVLRLGGAIHVRDGLDGRGVGFELRWPLVAAVLA